MKTLKHFINEAKKPIFSKSEKSVFKKWSNMERLDFFDNDSALIATEDAEGDFIEVSLYKELDRKDKTKMKYLILVEKNDEDRDRSEVIQQLDSKPFMDEDSTQLKALLKKLKV